AGRPVPAGAARTPIPAVERLFDTADLRAPDTRRLLHPDGGHLALGRSPALPFVAPGELCGDVPLPSGAAFLSTGRRPTLFEAGPQTRVVRAELTIEPGPFVDALPDRL